MYAIVVDGGRQHKVREGQEVTLDYRDASPGQEIAFEKIVAASDGSKLSLGSPLLSGAKVTAEVVGSVQGPKLVVQKFRRRKNSRRRTGHRQLHTLVRIRKIELA